MIFRILLFVYLAAGISYWLYLLYIIIRVIKSVPLMEDLAYDEKREWPEVSIIIPACNEADTIEPAMQTRLDDDYPNFEILLVDDRSTDKTPEIIAGIAARDKRVRPIYIKELPDGWLGKLYALHRGVQEARGNWFLFSDADVHIAPTALKRAVAYCEVRGLDHLAVFPELYKTNLFLDSVLAVFVRMLCMWCQVWAVEDRKSQAFVGSGSFNLVRRSAFEKTKGFEWLRLEVCDDVALGQMLKKAGAFSSVVNGRKFVGVYFYKTVREMAIGAERATFTVFGNFSTLRLLAGSILSLAIELMPFILLFFGVVPLLRYIGLALILIALTISVLANSWTSYPVVTGLLFPIGTLIMNVIAMRAAVLGGIRGGIIWRGTFYPTEVLRKGRRLDFQFLFFK